MLFIDSIRRKPGTYVHPGNKTFDKPGISALCNIIPKEDTEQQRMSRVLQVDILQSF